MYICIYAHMYTCIYIYVVYVYIYKRLRTCMQAYLLVSQALTTPVEAPPFLRTSQKEEVEHQRGSFWLHVMKGGGPQVQSESD